MWRDLDPITKDLCAGVLGLTVLVATVIAALVLVC